VPIVREHRGGRLLHPRRAIDAVMIMSHTAAKLFQPTIVGPYELSHRAVMAPLTRMRSEPGDVPGDLMVQYYTQRASEGGLIISEATPVSVRGYGYAGAPAIYADRQIDG
jgi:N-ethylmaleimide reductase